MYLIHNRMYTISASLTFVILPEQIQVVLRYSRGSSVMLSSNLAFLRYPDTVDSYASFFAILGFVHFCHVFLFTVAGSNELYWAASKAGPLGYGIVILGGDFLTAMTWG